MDGWILLYIHPFIHLYELADKEEGEWISEWTSA